MDRVASHCFVAASATPTPRCHRRRAHRRDALGDVRVRREVGLGTRARVVESSIALGKTSKTCQDFIGLVHRALGEQLDWSLDDLGFEPSEVEDLRNGVIRDKLYNRLRALADKS